MDERPRDEETPDDEAGPGTDRPDDWKMYTGEPVETDEGRKRPQQMNVGRENMEGGGEWPDPETPPEE
jgi:hypothetical protein